MENPSLRQDEKARLAALLDAQRALPQLVRHLSSGLVQATPDQCLAWAGWIRSLQDDPAWPILSPCLDSSRSWPDVWHRARQAGFSPTTEHHQAIFFTRLFEIALEEERLEVARWAWREAMTSWRSLSETNYLEEVALAGLADLTEAQKAEAISGLLDSTFELLQELAHPALRLSHWEESVSRRPLLHTMDALATTGEFFDDAPAHPLSDGIRAAAARVTSLLCRAVHEELQRHLDELALAEVDRKSVLRVFDGALHRLEELRFPPELDGAVLRRGLATVWGIREIGREEELDLLSDMVTRLRPCAERLLDAGDDDLFGFQGPIADLYVFEGEDHISRTDKEESFRRALQICPGHRNASKLLAYTLLDLLHMELLKITLVPGAAGLGSPLKGLVQPTLEKARQHYEEALEIYPYSKELPVAREALEKELARFGIDDEPLPEVPYEDQ